MTPRSRVQFLGAAALAIVAAGCASERDAADRDLRAPGSAHTVRGDVRYDPTYMEHADDRIADAGRRIGALQTPPRGVTLSEQERWQTSLENAQLHYDAARGLCESTRARSYENWDLRKAEIERQLAAMETAVVQCEQVAYPR